MSKRIANDFYQKTTTERIKELSAIGAFSATYNTATPPTIFEHLIENYITTFELGFGVAPNFLVDGTIYHVPLVTEESSVIAGASHAAKIIFANGGFTTESLTRRMIGQIIFKNILDQNKLQAYLEKHAVKLKEIGYAAHPEIHALGGGIHALRTEIKPHNFVTLYVEVDTLDAMGANTINTMLEAIANYIMQDYKAEVLMSILSNLATESLVTSTVKIDPKTLKHSDVIGEDIALANTYASIDPYRATTHNKGVMNGISALMLATGNDTRSIEAGAHSYAALSGTYLPLTKWYMEDGFLIGKITLPLAVGTVGGAINILPKVKLAHSILNIKDAKTLMKVAAAVGLAQNFAALYALTTDGINKGHMRLHARNIALEAGATPQNIEEVIAHMVNTKSITLKTAQDFLYKKK